MKIMLYTKPGCPSCEKAKAYLAEHGVAYTTHVVNDQGARDKLYSEWSAVDGLDLRTMPQVFVDGERLVDSHGYGGWDALEVSGLGESYKALTS